MKSKITSNYFKTLLKQQIPTLIFNTVIFSLTYTIPLILQIIDNMGIYEEKPTINEYTHFYHLSTQTGFIIFALAMYALAVPIYSLTYLTKKKQIDTYYSLPISRTKIAILHILCGAIYVLIPFTAVFITGSLITLCAYPEVQYGYYLLEYLLLVVMFVLYLMFNTFFYTRANRISDGIFTMIFANFVLVLIEWSNNTLFDYYIFDGDLILALIPFWGFIEYGNFFDKLITAKYDYKDYVTSEMRYGGFGKTMPNEQWYSKIMPFEEWYGKIGDTSYLYFIVLLIVGVLAIVLFIILHKKRKPELAEENSHSKFGLEILTPIIYTCLTILLCSNGDVIARLVIFSGIALFYLATTVLELRSFKIPLYKILILIGMSTLLIITGR